MSADWLTAIRPVTWPRPDYLPRDERRTVLMNSIVVAGNATSVTMYTTLSLVPTFSLAATTATIDEVEVLVSEPLLNGFYKR